MNSKEFYQEYGTGTYTVEYSHCIDGQIISVVEKIEVNERKCMYFKDGKCTVQTCGISCRWNV